MNKILILLLAPVVFFSSCVTTINDPVIERKLGYRKGTILEVVQQGVYYDKQGKHLSSYWSTSLRGDREVTYDVEVPVGTRIRIDKVQVLDSFDTNYVRVRGVFISGKLKGRKISNLTYAMRDETKLDDYGKLLGVKYSVLSLPKIDRRYLEVVRY